RYPMGLNQQQWEALPASQQADYQAKQYAIDEDRRKQAESQRMEQERLRIEQEKATQERLRQIYANARYGDIVQVSVQGGSIEYAGKRYPYEPVAFDLAKGETKQIAFRGRGLQTIATRYNVRLTEDGNTIYFDDSFRERIVLVNRDWERGESSRQTASRNEVGVAISGMTFFVKFKDLLGAPQRVIIEHRVSGQRPEFRR
ncbi:MAG: hypothetical protein WCL44_16050, partial [bacterium]